MTKPTDPPRYCHCRDGRSRWRIAAGDLFCGLCGGRLERIRPRDLPLGRDLESGLAVYLRPRGSGLFGRAVLAISGAPGEDLSARFDPVEGEPLGSLALGRPATGWLALDFSCGLRAGGGTGAVGRWRV